MNKLRKVEFNTKYICLTAYKAFMVLKYLIVKPVSRDEIRNIFSLDSFVSQIVSNESIRVIINSLKELGCKISRPSSTNDFQYKLNKNPFSLNLTKEEISLINKFRKNSLDRSNWKEIAATNSLVEKICLLTDDENTIEELKNYSPLFEIDFALVSEIEKCCENKSEVIFEYLSGKKLSEFRMITSFLKFEKGRLYVWGYSFKYNDFSYLRVDKIKNIRIINEHCAQIYNSLVVRYKMFNSDYVLKENEVLVQKSDKFFVIDYRIENKFYAIQRFLEMGADCEIISPTSFIEEFVDTLISIKKEYTGE